MITPIGPCNQVQTMRILHNKQCNGGMFHIIYFDYLTDITEPLYDQLYQE